MLRQSVLTGIALVALSCQSTDEVLSPEDQPPPATPVGEPGRSEAWSAPSPALLEAATEDGFTDYRTQLDLARAGSEGAMTRIQSWSAFAAAKGGEVAASHTVSLRELQIIQPELFERALSRQRTVAIREAVRRSLNDTH